MPAIINKQPRILYMSTFSLRNIFPDICEATNNEADAKGNAVDRGNSLSITATQIM